LREGNGGTAEEGQEESHQCDFAVVESDRTSVKLFVNYLVAKDHAVHRFGVQLRQVAT
jgi:hypothetical protein